MAKKSGFNMSLEIRRLLTANKNLSGPEVYELLRKKFPGKSINKGSCQVAFTNSRKKLGLRGKKRGRQFVRKVTKPSTDTVSLSALRSARELLANTNGDVAMATAILKEMKALQG